MSYFPFMIDIENKKCLVAGGGKIACHKVKILLGFGVKLFVVAPSFDAEFSRLVYGEGQISFQKREFLNSDVEGMDFAVAATGIEALDFHISSLCQEKGVLVNVVDRKEWCTFIFPALLQEDGLLIAVSTGGQSPAAAAYLKEKLRKEIPAYYGRLVKKLGEYRDYIFERVGTAKERRQVFYKLLEYGDSHGGELPEDVISVNEKNIHTVCDGISKSVNMKNDSGIRKIRIGTRGSRLALAQTNLVAAALQERFPDVLTETVILRTQGDKILDKPLLSFGGKGAFVTEIEQALLEDRIDIAVHSAKDMPMKLEDSLEIAGVLKRADARDVLVMQKGSELEEWLSRRGNLAVEEYAGKTFKIGTGSPRRQFQLKKCYPECVCKNIRGNVPTRLEKLRSGEYDGLVLAAAGLERLGLLEEEDLAYRFFSQEEMLSAGGQGIIAIEGHTCSRAAEMVREISDEKTYFELLLERKLLELADAGCHDAVGVKADSVNENVRIRFLMEREGQETRLDETVEADKAMEFIERLFCLGMEADDGKSIFGRGRAR